ncbi:MAG: hypothetical protein QOH43_393 [Solirubrobacteraceae bacterium]|nr:hypothetical protein [Solirubrobacteraceae bacterium]
MDLSRRQLIVGPITLLICPICGPLKLSRAPHAWAEVLPAFPPIDGRVVPTQPAVPILVAADCLEGRGERDADPRDLRARAGDRSGERDCARRDRHRHKTPADGPHGD